MWISNVLFLLLLVTLVLVVISEAARGRSGGGRGGGRSRSRGSSRSRSSLSPNIRITKYTPIKPTTASSPVIVTQTKVGLRSGTFKKAVYGYIVLHHRLKNAIVFRQGYPMYGSYVSIPDKRAVRITSEEENLLDSEGYLCLGQSYCERTLTKN